MKMNLHTHTPRCHHATGSEREYIERAIAAGLQTLGFSDHAPMPFLGDYYSTFRMRPEETRGYIDALLALREEYKDRIQILIGFEAEYYPEVFPRFREFIAQFPIDYLLLGQHFLGNEKDSPYSCRKTKDESLFCAYVDQVCEALKTGAYSYLAHPDLMYYDGDEAAFQKHARRLCECAAETDTPLEINLLGLREDRHYPTVRFFKIAAEVGNAVVLGVDAHQPECIGEPNSLKRAKEIAEECGIQILEDIPYHSPNQK